MRSMLGKKQKKMTITELPTDDLTLDSRAIFGISGGGPHDFRSSSGDGTVAEKRDRSPNCMIPGRMVKGMGVSMEHLSRACVKGVIV